MSEPAQIQNLSQVIPTAVAPIHALGDIVQKMGTPTGRMTILWQGTVCSSLVSSAPWGDHSGDIEEEPMFFLFFF